MSQTTFTKSALETQKLAQDLARSLKGDKILALYGNLGSGKTTFVQGLAKGLGIKERMISPTFIIIREHKISEKLKAKSEKFYHIDLYRVQNFTELKELELEEILGSKDRIVAIEWAEKIKELLPKNRIEIYFENLGENRRRITVVPMI